MSPRHATDPNCTGGSWPPKSHFFGFFPYFFQHVLRPDFWMRFWSIFSRKNCQNQWFWPLKPPPKHLPKPSKIDVPKTCGFLLFFERWSFKFQTFETLKISIFLKENCYFSGFRQNGVLTILANLGFQRSSKKPIKTSSKPWKNRVWKRPVFQHRIFRVFGSILAGFGRLLGLSWEALGVQNGVQEG